MIITFYDLDGDSMLHVKDEMKTIDVKISGLKRLCWYIFVHHSNLAFTKLLIVQ